jgi:hypothetical protein
VDVPMVVRVGVELQAIESDTLPTDGDLGEIGANLGVEAVSIHSEIGGDVPESDESRGVLRPSVDRVSHAMRLAGCARVVDEKLRFHSFELCGPLDGSPDLQVARDARWPLPGTVEMPLPVRLLMEGDHEHADREPVQIARGRLEAVRAVLEVPADMLDLPLVRADLPAAIDDDGDRLRALDLAANRRPPRSR